MTETLSVNPSVANLHPSLEQLRPYEVIDDAGFSRQVYTFGSQELVFKGREELPSIPGFEQAITAGAEEAPRFSASTVNVEAGHDTTKIVANQTPLGVVEAGISLGIQSEALSKSREELLKGEYSPSTLDMIDSIIACRIIDGEGYISDHANQEAEALVLLALSGDEQAQQEVSKRKEILSTHDTTTRQKKLESAFEGKEMGEALDPDNLLLVRKTNYVPEVTENGAVVLRSTADITDGRYLRPSIHFSLDTAVVANNAGNWDGERFTIVDTFGSVLAARKRPPTNIASNDTWFDQNPGEPLVLPTAKVFEADLSHTGDPVENGVITTYNPNETSVDDLIAAERIKRGIEAPSDTVSEHGWGLSSPKGKKLESLGQKLGIRQEGHFYTDDMKLSRRASSQVVIADSETEPEVRAKKLFEGGLEVDWKKLANDYAYVDEDNEPADKGELEIPEGALPKWAAYGELYEGGSSSLNRILVDCTPEARRNFYASGLSIPRIAVVQGKRNARIGRFG